MAAIHLIERKSLFSRVTSPSTEYESGFWSLSEAQAQLLVGGKIYFHQRQIEPSFYGGVITGFRVQQGEPHNGRIIFRFEPNPECRGIRAGRGGWQFEKKIVA
jgi:hypothetical protein